MTHMFDTTIATELGVNAAILFQHIAFWCIHSEANGTNYHDGAYWTYSSNKAFRKVFPYLSASQIDTALKKLLASGLIIRGNYNKSAYDRTMWYAITENGKSIFKKSKMEIQKTVNGSAENREPIPDIVTNSTDTTNDNKDINTRKRFTPPTVEDVQAYADEKGWSGKEFSAESFTNYYQSIGWVIRGKQMKDWQAAARGWVSRYRQEHPEQAPRVYKDADYENDW